MEIHSIFNLMEFRAMTFREWRRHYAKTLGPRNWISEFESMKTGLHLADSSTEMYLPWYRSGRGFPRDHLTGKPVRATLGKRTVLVRLPAVKVGRRFLVLDGCHRMTQIKPAIVVLDYVEPTRQQRMAFMDLSCKFWKGR